MKCRKCSSKNTRVTCTDHFEKSTKRYCRCLDCGEKFRTIEMYELGKPGPPKGRPRLGNIARGSSHGSSVFTEEDIVAMRQLHREGKTLKQIAEKYGVGSSYISKIVNYKQWKHVA
jgi:hypothetical protein